MNTTKSVFRAPYHVDTPIAFSIKIYNYQPHGFNLLKISKQKSSESMYKAAYRTSVSRPTYAPTVLGLRQKSAAYL
jgi:hypothetical protein